MKSPKNLLVELHQDDEGMETLQVVIIFGVAAIILSTLYIARTKIWGWVSDSLTKLGITVDSAQ